VVLEARSSTGTNKIASHVLCNHGNEIFMHCLVFCGKSQLDDRPSISENIGGINCRINDFNEIVKLNRFMQTVEVNDKESPLNKTIDKIERITRKWPMAYSDSIVASINSVCCIFIFIYTQ
jgi:hypothetical protein